VVVISDPDADNECIVEADEPGIPVVLHGAGLAADEARQRGGASGAALHDVLQ
jgi:hypothetical protein